MKKIMLFSVIAIIMLAACSKKTTPASSTASTSTADPVKTETEMKQPTADLAVQGKGIFDTKCQRCHQGKQAANYTTVQWESILEKMAPRAKLTEEETKQVHAYVMAHAKK